MRKLTTFKLTFMLQRNEELFAVSINAISIKDREDRLTSYSKKAPVAIEATSFFNNTSNKSKVFASCEILLGNGVTESKALVAVSRYYDGFKLTAFVRFVNLLKRHGIELYSNHSNDATIVSLLCQWADGDLIKLIRLLIDSHYDSNQTSTTSWNVLKTLCSLYSNSYQLIEAICELGDRGVEIVRLQCDDLDDVDRVCEILANIFAYLMRRLSRFKCQSYVLPLIIEDHKLTITAGVFIKFVLQSIPVALKIHYSPLRSDRDLFVHYKGEMLRVNTLERNIALPSFPNWKQLHQFWHGSCSPDKRVIDLVFKYLDENSHGNCSSITNCSWCTIAEDIDSYLKRLMHQVKQDNELFEVEEIIKYGSSAEKTNIFRPSEFDRGVILKNFRQSSRDAHQIVYVGDDPERASLKDEKAPFNSSCLFYEFMKTLQDAVERIYSAHVFSPTVIYGDTCLTISFMYRCRCLDTAMKASIDLTIAVRTVTALRMSPMDLNCCSFQYLPVEEFLVPNRRGFGGQWQVSYPTLERKMLLQSGHAVKRVYQMLKLLVALESNKAADVGEIPQKSCVSSYAIKTCLFRYMRYRYKPPPWQDHDVLVHAVNVLKLFPASKVTSFFVKDLVAFEVTDQSREVIDAVTKKLELIVKSERKLVYPCENDKQFTLFQF